MAAICRYGDNVANAVPRPERSLGADELQRDLARLGVLSGDALLVHASLRAVGWIDGGPTTLIEALQKVVGPRGLLVMPTFNHGAPYSEAGPGYYDPNETPSSSGLLSEHFWRMPDVTRSLAPTHPMAAWGDGAAELLRDHEQGAPLGRHSPIDKLTQRGGKILHLGTNHRSSSAKHLAEHLEEAPCLLAPLDHFPVRQPVGASEYRLVMFASWRYRERPCPLHDDSDALDQLMQHRQKTARVGRAVSSLCSLADFIEVSRALLRRGTEKAPPCRACPIGPSARREGDWD